MRNTVLDRWSTSIPRRIAAAVLCLGTLAGCANHGQAKGPGETHDIRILDHISPQQLHVQVGDEVRWHNLRTTPVTIGLLSPLTSDRVSCGKGFTRFGLLDDSATVPPGGYVSLCFARAGAIHYNVWLNPDDPFRSMTPTARVVVTGKPS